MCGIIIAAPGESWAIPFPCEVLAEVVYLVQSIVRWLT